ncbi:MAG: hypothetical protein WEA77_06405 [Hyphomonas sp.]|uniref:hypothetical protein n=1 Tax=Hyphomonas sp. TaxID=87 RepID=UPI0034A03F6D
MTDPGAPETTPGVQDGAASGSAGQIDGAVASPYKIQAKAEIADSVTARMTLADKDNNGQLSMEEYNVLAPAPGHAENSITPSGEGGPVAEPGAGDVTSSSTATPIRAD